MIFVYPNSASTFVGSKVTAISAGYIEVSDEIYADLVETKRMWQDGKIVLDPDYPARKKEQEEEEERRRHIEEIQQQIASLKAELASSDYKAIKYAEGWISEEEYAPIKAEREAIREQIRALENN